MKRFYLCLCGLVFLLIASVSAQDSSLLNFPEKDFATPQAAINHFVESIAKNDAVAALQAFAVNQYAEEFDFAAQTKHLNALDIYQSLAPTDTAMYTQLNRLSLLAKYGQNIKLFCYSFYSTESLEGKIVAPINDRPERIDAFITSVNPKQLTNLKIAKVFKLTILSERLQNTLEEQAKIVGAEEFSEFVVFYELDGDYFAGGIHLLGYDGAWKIDSLGSALTGVSAVGTVLKTTPEALRAFLGEDHSNLWKLEQIQ